MRFLQERTGPAGQVVIRNDTGCIYYSRLGLLMSPYAITRGRVRKEGKTMAQDDPKTERDAADAAASVPVRATDPQKPGETVKPEMEDRRPGADPPEVEPTYTNTRQPAPSGPAGARPGDNDAL
jgi:hypothetical protein